GSTGLADDAYLVAGFLECGCYGCADRISECNVGHDPFTEEGADTGKGTIDELIRNHEVRGLVLFLQRSNGGDGKDLFHPQHFHPIDVCAKVQLTGQEAV